MNMQILPVNPDHPKQISSAGVRFDSKDGDELVKDGVISRVKMDSCIPGGTGRSQNGSSSNHPLSEVRVCRVANSSLRQISDNAPGMYSQVSARTTSSSQPHDPNPTASISSISIMPRCTSCHVLCPTRFLISLTFFFPFTAACTCSIRRAGQIRESTSR